MWDDVIIMAIIFAVLFVSWRWILKRSETNIYEQTAELTEIRDNLRKQLWGDE